MVLYPIKSEYWDHMHCNPLHLQMELPPHMENKEEDAAYRRARKRLVIIVITKESAIQRKQLNGV